MLAHQKVADELEEELGVLDHQIAIETAGMAVIEEGKEETKVFYGLEIRQLEEYVSEMTRNSNYKLLFYCEIFQLVEHGINVEMNEDERDDETSEAQSISETDSIHSIAQENQQVNNQISEDEPNYEANEAPLIAGTSSTQSGAEENQAGTERATIKVKFIMAISCNN